MAQMSEEITEDEHVPTTLELARESWENYFRMSEGYASPECVFGKMAEAVVMLANDIHPDDEDGLEEATAGVTMRPEVLAFDLSSGAGQIYLSTTVLYGIREHFSRLVLLLTWLAQTYERQEQRRADSDGAQRAAAGELRDRLAAVTQEVSDRAPLPVTQARIRAVHGELLVLGPRLERAQDVTLSSIEQRRRLALIQVAQVRTLECIAYAQRAAYWLTQYVDETV